MDIYETGSPDLRLWAEQYAEEAIRDDFEIGRITVEDGCCTDSETGGESVAKGTVWLTSLAYSFGVGAQLGDGRTFLAKQVYDRRKSESRYMLVFELGQHPIAQLFIDAIDEIDFADLLASHGARHINIFHPNGERFEDPEHAVLERAIREDYDYDSSEIHLEFHRYSFGLQIEVWEE